MILNLIVALLVVVIPVIWSTKGKGYGMFSSFLGAVCTVAAGGVAFAVWEPLSNMLLEFGGDGSTFFGAFVQGAAWGLGLLLPFIVSMLIFRLAVDSLVPANLDFSETANLAGGIGFGIVTGVVSVGILVISLGFMRLPAAMLGFNPIEEKNGAPVHSGGLWIPVDTLTIKLYEGLSRHSFSSSTPLATRLPKAHQAASLQRMTYKDATRNTLLPKDFEVLGRYKITGPLDSLLMDTYLVDVTTGQGKKQTVFYPDGSQPTNGATLESYAIRFGSGAKDKGGNVVVTPAQIRLVVAMEDGSVKTILPIAVIAPPEAGAQGLYRFRFDTKESFIASQGGSSESIFAFEFLLPPGAVAQDLFVKNTRVDLTSTEIKETAFADYKARDRSITDGSVFRSLGGASAAASGPLEKRGSIAVEKQSNRFPGVELGSTLPNNMTINKTNRGGLQVNEKNEIIDGQHILEKAMTQERGLDRNLRIESFVVSKDVGIFKLELAREGARSLYGRSVETAEGILPPMLIDDRGNRYEPVGYVYDDGQRVEIRFTPGQPLRALSEAPALSRTQRSQTLYLLFRPTKGVKIMSFVLGNKEIASFPEGVEINQ